MALVVTAAAAMLFDLPEPVTVAPPRVRPAPEPLVDRPYRDIRVTDAELAAAYVTPARARRVRLDLEADARPGGTVEYWPQRQSLPCQVCGMVPARRHLNGWLCRAHAPVVPTPDPARTLAGMRAAAGRRP